MSLEPTASVEDMDKIEISPIKPEDYRGTLEVQYLAALENYPNREFGITPSDIRRDYAKAFTKDEIKKGEER